MKVVILAGGFGTRLSEESQVKPKPMVNIGEQPILWHIMKLYSHYGFNEFIICLGYKGEVIKEYFANYFLRSSDVTFDLEKNEIQVHNTKSEPWKVTLVDTGLNTMTGGRIKRIKDYIGDETFMLTYGDGVSDINIKELLTFHKKQGKIATITTTNRNQKFGVLNINENNEVTSFREKNEEDCEAINGGFMVLEPAIFNYLSGDDTVFEKTPLEQLTKEKQLSAYRHQGYWQCMDTLREKILLESLWNENKAPWKVWKD